MAEGKITRTVFYAKAFSWQVDGENEDGSPHLAKVGDVEFVSTAPSQLQAYRALKNAGVIASSKFCGFDIVREAVLCMDLDTFIAHAVEVTRGRNGKVADVETGERGQGQNLHNF